MKLPLACPLRSKSRSHPDNTAIMDGQRIFTYREFDRLIDNIGRHLAAWGITPGDTVAVLAVNSIEYAALFFAAFRLGFTLAPLNTRMTEDDWSRQLDNIGYRLFVHDDAISFRPREDIRSVRIHEMVIQSESSLPDSKDIEHDGAREALIIYSSGSTGSPRGVVLSWKNIHFSAIGTNIALRMVPSDSWLAVLPFFHIGGMMILYRMALLGGTSVIADRFDPPAILALLGRHDIRYVSLVPTMLKKLLDHGGADSMKKMKGVVIGGAAFESSLRDEVAKKHLPILASYGMTETTSMVTLLPPDSPREKSSTSGRVLPHREISVTDDRGKPVSTGTTGHIKVRGEVLSPRYLAPDIRSVDAAGWFDTGDMGSLDDDGFLTVLGRTDDMIVSGGENIDMARIRDEILSLDNVDNAVVMARPDKIWGQRPVAFVVLSGDVSDQSILDTLRTRLPKIMIPDQIILVDKIPLTAAGKYDYAALRRQYRDIFTLSN